jgi:hypothetical protein
MLAWMYIVPLMLFWLAKGRFYYVCGSYPMLIAMGAAAAERWLAARPRWMRIALPSFFLTGVAAFGAYAFAMLVPIASNGSLREFALSKSGDLREEIGWEELVQKVAAIRDSLSTEQQAHLGIAVGNYGEAGAIEILGPAYHLPPPISTTNSFWYRTFPVQEPTTVILLGNSRERADEIFTGCRLVAHNANSEGVKNEESEDHPDIFLCGPLKFPWRPAWNATQEHDFG